jgi:hypothetical protein
VTREILLYLSPVTCNLSRLFPVSHIKIQKFELAFGLCQSAF